MFLFYVSSENKIHKKYTQYVEIKLNNNIGVYEPLNNPSSAYKEVFYSM